MYTNYYLVRRALALPRIFHQVKKKRSNWQVPQVFWVGVIIKERDSQGASKSEEDDG
jgi:hypothetical protein